MLKYRVAKKRFAKKQSNESFRLPFSVMYETFTPEDYCALCKQHRPLPIKSHSDIFVCWKELAYFESLINPPVKDEW